MGPDVVDGEERAGGRDVSTSRRRVTSVERLSGDIQVIGRCGHLLRLFSTTQASLRVADVEAALGLQRTTAHRYLTSMANAGFLEREDDGSFALGPLLVQLGTVALRGQRVLELAGPYMQQLADDADATVVLSLWGGLGAVVARMCEASDRLVNISIRVGSPLPLEAAQTRVFLAFLGDPMVEQRLLAQLPDARRREITEQLEDVRREGYIVSDEVVRGIRAIAAPVIDGHGEVCATLAIICMVGGMPERPPSRLVVALMRTAERLSRQLGYADEPPYAAFVENNENAS